MSKESLKRCKDVEKFVLNLEERFERFEKFECYLNIMVESYGLQPQIQMLQLRVSIETCK